MDHVLSVVLSVVADVFEIAGRGCVIVPGIPGNSTLRIRVGDPVHLVRPDKTILETYVAGLEFFSGGGSAPLLLPPEIQKSDVPIGTEVVLVQA